MTITPEQLRELAQKQLDNPYSVAPWVIERHLIEAAERIELLETPAEIMVHSRDDCDCFICESWRNPPKTTELAIKLMRDFRKNQGLEP